MSQTENNQSNLPERATFSRKGKFDRTLYEKFIWWYGLPINEKYKEGLETKKKFAAYHQIDEATLWRWTKRRDFEAKVSEHIHSWIKARKPDILASIYAGAVTKLNPLSQMLWLKAFEGFTEKAEAPQTPRVEVTPRDIRYIIGALPDAAQRQKFYGYLGEINSAATAARRSGEFVDGEIPDESEDELPEATEQHAQELPQPTADDVAKSDPCCLRRDLEWQVSPHHYQSTARWW
jgi:hypothetical protein